MNLQNIIQEIEEKVDPEIHERMDSRRSALREFAGIGGKLALAAVPIALGSFFKKSYGQTSAPSTAKILEILNYALGLEHLEAEFYTQSLTQATITFPSPASNAAITKIKNDEVAHVKFLQGVITQLGGTPVAKGTYKFLNNPTFGNVFVNYGTFLTVAQALEDTGVRAYKGRAKELTKGGDILTAALNIHSVEARHASHIRQMRRAAVPAAAAMKPWITGGNDSGFPGIDPVYGGSTPESTTVQATVNIATLAGVGGNIGVNAASESFDEPLTVAEVSAIASLFV